MSTADVSEVHAAAVAMGPLAYCQRLGLSVKRDRRGVVGPCPIHGGDNQRSWSLHERNGRLLYNCLTHDCRGDAITLAGELAGASGFAEQLRAAAEIAGVALGVTDPAEREARKRRRAAREADARARRQTFEHEREAAYDARARLYGELWGMLELQGPAVPYLRKRGMLHPQQLYAPAHAAGVVWCTPERGAEVLNELRPRWGDDALVRYGLQWPADKLSRRDGRGPWRLVLPRQPWRKGAERDDYDAARWIAYPLLIPLHDAASRLLWFQGRTLDDVTEDESRWHSPGSTPLEHATCGQGPALYGAAELQHHDPAHAWAMLCEGGSDYVAARVWRVELARMLDVSEVVVVGKGGNGPLTAEAAAQLRGWRVVVGYDADAASRKGLSRTADSLRAAGATSARYLRDLPDGYDLAKYLRRRFAARPQPQQRSAATDRSETRSDAA